MTYHPPHTTSKAWGGAVGGSAGLGLAALVYEQLQPAIGELWAGLVATLVAAGLGYAGAYVAPRNRDKDGWGRYGG